MVGTVPRAQGLTLTGQRQRIGGMKATPYSPRTTTEANPRIARGVTAFRLTAVLSAVALLVALPAFAQTPATSPDSAAAKEKAATTAVAESAAAAATSAVAAPAAGQPSEAELMKMMMEMGAMNENHKLLGEVAGDWTYTLKMWMAPGAPPSESKGTVTRKPEMGGRFFIADVAGKFQMPGPDGKMKDMDFRGRATDGYDNAKGKFVSTWYDNMSTGIMFTEGTYDAASKSLTYTGSYVMMPGTTIKVRQVIKMIDKDHHSMDYYEDRGGKETKTMEIAYTRKK